MSMSYLFGLLHSFVIQRQSGSDHSGFVIFTPLTSDNGFVGQALPLAIRWIGRRRACPTVLLTDNRSANGRIRRGEYLTTEADLASRSLSGSVVATVSAARRAHPPRRASCGEPLALYNR